LLRPGINQRGVDAVAAEADVGVEKSKGLLGMFPHLAAQEAAHHQAAEGAVQRLKHSHRIHVRGFSI